ncbi:hypothetical protein SRB5_27460 [Streptomyces sp. RB5]|uniref:Uncharacterized protein n=1 Tax=Streptomyces smaragdinus TaxID=2585196 RepID=A0A7K0CGK8_9ACTN|nr:hypothetical protein [Streptomyces smaragdinus]MQY12610.1 hypothetical protein [Streptomyces smaragdinus]
MAISNPGRTRPDRDHHHCAPHPEDCDLSGVDDLACESRGVADRAKYIADHEAALKERRATYDTTRTAYTTARAAAAADVAAIRKDLHRIREQLHCQLDQDTTECLDEAWDEIRERLGHCGVPHAGCCVEDCDFDEECAGHEDDTIDELTARITRIDGRVTAAEACFDALTGEPAALTARVAGLRTAVDALLTEISDPKTVDPKHAYATLRWLWSRYDGIWWGFPRVRDFQDCLCRALTCSVTGRRLLGVLTGRLGVLKCRKEAADQRCETLRTHVVDEVLAAYARRCRPCPDGGSGSGSGSGPADEAEDGDDCGEENRAGERGGSGRSRGSSW